MHTDRKMNRPNYSRFAPPLQGGKGKNKICVHVSPKKAPAKSPQNLRFYRRPKRRLGSSFRARQYSSS